MCSPFGHVTYKAGDMPGPLTEPGIRWRYGWICVNYRGGYEIVPDRSVIAVEDVGPNDFPSWRSAATTLRIIKEQGATLP